MRLITPPPQGSGPSHGGMLKKHTSGAWHSGTWRLARYHEGLGAGEEEAAVQRGTRTISLLCTR